MHSLFNNSHNLEYKVIKKSKYFNKKWYLKTYSDVKESKFNPIEHYLNIGWTKGYNPSLKFDGNAYLESNQDVKHAGMNPLFHYEYYGKKEGRHVCPVISFNFYNKLYYFMLKTCKLLHLISYKTYVLQQRRFLYPGYYIIYKSKYFDEKYYTDNHPEIDKKNAIIHYMERGFLMGYNPSKKFDNDSYLNSRPDVLLAGMNPLYHYETAGKYENMKPTPVKKELNKYPSEVPSNSILLFSHELSLTGAPMALLNLAKAVKKLGYFPVVFSPKHGDLEQDLQKNSISYIVDDQIFLKLYKADLEINCFFNKFKLIVFNTIVTLRYAKLINTNAQKIMWVHEGSFGYESMEYDFNIKEAFEYIDNVYSVGNYSKSFTDKYIPKNKSNILLYGIEELKENLTKTKKSDKLSFGIFGFVSKRKGVDIFVDAVKKLPKSIKDKCEFKVVGMLSDDKWTNDVIESAKGEPIIFTGQMQHDQMMQEMNNTDVVVCCSLDDPMPIVCTEAMQLSIPVICSDLTGTAGFIKDSENSFVWHADKDKLENIFIKAYKNKDKLEKIGKRWNQVYVKNFTKEAFVENIKNILKDCSEKNNKEQLVYDLFVPMGVSCHCSMLLRMLGLQQESYPFDWSGHEEHHKNHDQILKEKIKLICSDFEHFVDKKDMIEVPERQEQNAEHRYMINKKTGLHYVHDFPIYMTIQEYFPEFINKYERRAKRLLNDIKGSRKVALIWIQDTWDQIQSNNETLSNKVVSEQLELLKSKFPDTDFDFLIFNNCDLFQENLIKKYEDGHILTYVSNHSCLFDTFYSKKYNQYMIKTIYNILSKFAF